MSTQTDKYSILIINHKPSRDLPGTYSVAYYLHTMYDHNVTLLDSFGMSGNGWEWARHMQPDVIIFPKVIDPPRFLEEVEQFTTLQSYDPFCIVLPTERHSSIQNRVPLDGVDLFLAWNTDHAERNQRQHGIKEENTEIVGCPRYDLFSEENKLSEMEVVEAYEKYGIPRGWNGDIVTIATSFTRADEYLYNRERLEHRKDQIERFGWGGRDDVIPHAKAKHETRESFIDLIKEINEEYTDVWISLKIHPTENARRYRETIGDLERVSIATDGYSARHLQTSDCHIHHDCTTGIEAFMLDVPSINFIPHKYENIEGSKKGSGSFEAHSVSKIIDIFNKVREDNIQIPDDMQANGEQYITSQFTAIDGKRAEKTAEVINTRLSETSITRHSLENSFRKRLYSATAVDILREPNESLVEFSRQFVLSVVKSIKDRPTKTGRSGGDLPQVLSNQLDIDDIREVEQLVNLPVE